MENKRKNRFQKEIKEASAKNSNEEFLGKRRSVARTSGQLASVDKENHDDRAAVKHSNDNSKYFHGYSVANGKVSVSSKGKRAIKLWTKDEDTILKEWVAQHGGLTKIDKELLLMLPNRSEKCIRSRYSENLDPKLSKVTFTSEEKNILLQNLFKYSTRWGKFTKALPNRSYVAIRNYWEAHFRAIAKMPIAAYIYCFSQGIIDLKEIWNLKIVNLGNSENTGANTSKDSEIDKEDARKGEYLLENAESNKLSEVVASKIPLELDHTKKGVLRYLLEPENERKVVHKEIILFLLKFVKNKIKRTSTKESEKTVETDNSFDGIVKRLREQKATNDKNIAISTIQNPLEKNIKNSDVNSVASEDSDFLLDQKPTYSYDRSLLSLMTSRLWTKEAFLRIKLFWRKSPKNKKPLGDDVIVISTLKQTKNNKKTVKADSAVIDDTASNTVNKNLANSDKNSGNYKRNLDPDVLRFKKKLKILRGIEFLISVLDKKIKKIVSISSKHKAYYDKIELEEKQKTVNLANTYTNTFEELLARKRRLLYLPEAQKTTVESPNPIVERLKKVGIVNNKDNRSDIDDDLGREPAPPARPLFQLPPHLKAYSHLLGKIAQNQYNK